MSGGPIGCACRLHARVRRQVLVTLLGWHASRTARPLMGTRELHEERMDLRVADILDRVGQSLPI